METSPLFMGSPWMALDVRPDGSCHPPPKVASQDVLRCERAYHMGQNVYSVTNMTKFYQCFVQLQKERLGDPLARCNHPECRHWQSIVKEPRPCKHIRCTVRWHVTLMRRVRALRRRAKDGDILRAIG
jgi:hypothetical protein